MSDCAYEENEVHRKRTVENTALRVGFLKTDMARFEKTKGYGNLTVVCSVRAFDFSLLLDAETELRGKDQRSSGPVQVSNDGAASSGIAKQGTVSTIFHDGNIVSLCYRKIGCQQIICARF